MKITFTLNEKLENSSQLRQKNTKDIIKSHKKTRTVKDGKD